MRLIDADELITAFPCGESVRTESVRATINHMPTIPSTATDTVKALREAEYRGYMKAVAERPQGEWIKRSSVGNWECSHCGIDIIAIGQEIAKYKACPNCIAKMKEVYDE